MTSYTYPEGFTTPVGDQEFFSYDDHNNTTTRTRTPVNDSSLANLVIQASWDQTWNKPVYIIDAMSHETNISYWPIGGTGASLIHQAIRPSPDGVQGRPTYTFTYNSFGKILTSTDPTNVVTSNTYDPSTGNLLSATVDPTGIDSIESYTYDTVGNVATVTDPNLYVTENQYDADRRKTYVLHHNGNVSAALLAAEHTIYDILGRVQEEDGGTQFNGITTSGVTWQMLKQTFYTPTSKVDHEFDGASDETIYTYDGMDRTTIVTDPLQRRVATVYDLAGETLYTWRGWNSATAPTASTSWSPSTYAGTGPVRYAAYTYFPNGEVAAVTDANNNLTSSTYDGFDRLAYLYFPSTTSGAGTSDTTDFEAYAYDPNGNRLSLQKRDGQVISYQYDNLNRQTLKILPNTTTLDVWSQYDLAGRPTSDYFGSATVLTTNGIVYSYDTAGRLTGENQFNIPMTYAYDNAGNRIRTTWPDNNWINYDFDGLNREWQIRENGAATSGGTVVATYVYDPLSRKKSLSLLNGASVGFGYDIASRLISLAQNFVTAPQDLAVTYQYTAASQLYIRSSNNALFDWLPTAASTPYVPDGLNRYASVNGVEYSYDGRGNLTSDGTNTYTFDVENRDFFGLRAPPRSLCPTTRSGAFSRQPLIRQQQDSFMKGRISLPSTMDPTTFSGDMCTDLVPISRFCGTKDRRSQPATICIPMSAARSLRRAITRVQCRTSTPMALTASKLPGVDRALAIQVRLKSRKLICIIIRRVCIRLRSEGFYRPILSEAKMTLTSMPTHMMTRSMELIRVDWGVVPESAMHPTVKHTVRANLEHLKRRGAQTASSMQTRVGRRRVRLQRAHKLAGSASIALSTTGQRRMPRAEPWTPTCALILL